MTMKHYGIDADRLNAMRAREDAVFMERTVTSQRLHERGKGSMPCGVPLQWMVGLYRHPPIHVTSGEGAHFEDADGNRYLDMNLADLAAFLGFAPPAITRAVADRARLGASFLLPCEDGIAACELLAAKTGMPFWQFSGSASAANTEALRIARFATGRERIVTFEGRYHG
ncbi:MAG: aminotransferase class III-fold pyridoxal phosphate-dependent enzyme, partial [Hyphomicrobiales bacterium]